MAKTSPASEGALNELHSNVAKALSRKLQVRTITRVVKDEPVTEEVEPTASEIMAAITFLKNNNIQAAADEDSALALMRKQVEEAQKRRAAALPDQHADVPPGMH